MSRAAAVQMLGILVISGVVLLLFYTGNLFGLSIDQLDDFLVVFTAVSLFATLWLLLTGRR